MVFNLFLVKLFFSFLIGGAWVVLSTVIAERYGTKLGGIITGFPSTAAFGLFFIAWTQTENIAVQATSIIPSMNLVNTLFILLLLTLVIVGFNSLIAVLFSLSLWAILGFFLFLIKIDFFWSSAIVYLAAMILTYYIIEKKMKIKSKINSKFNYTLSLLLMRGLFGGFVVAFAVVMAKIGGPYLGGLFSMFPALYLSTFIIAYKTHGKTFATALMKTAVFGAINIIVYSAIVKYSYPLFGIWLGTLASFSGSIVFAYIVYKFVIARMS